MSFRVLKLRRIIYRRKYTEYFKFFSSRDLEMNALFYVRIFYPFKQHVTNVTTRVVHKSTRFYNGSKTCKKKNINPEVFIRIEFAETSFSTYTQTRFPTVSFHCLHRFLKPKASKLSKMNSSKSEHYNLLTVIQSIHCCIKNN